ncbi:MAG: DUF1015 domain-containing protein [Lachnospiraceae bacterium]|nr:DUF1015 domain-containing protein [Lachnospiraceae bacterium]MCR4937932.1 DUF1015 domain-containing protein [Lachnospiraceae bacterium]
MAVIRPFKAVRPASGMEGKIAALPYDVYSREEAKEVVKANPDSFLAIDRAETSFPDDVDTYADEVYERAASLLKERIAKGDFITEEKPCYYIYELTMDGRTQTGITACASIDDYENAVIKKHENTRADKEVDRIRHVDTCSAQTGPIFLAYREDESISAVVNRIKQGSALYDITSDDGIRHRVFIVDDENDINTIKERFASINSIYIADGHHRCASAVKVGLKRREENPGFTGDEEFNYFLSVLFPDNELMIMDYNRVVHDLGGNTAESFIEKIKNRFEVSAPAAGAVKPGKKGSFGMYLDGKWYSLAIKDEYKNDDPVEGLDVSLLQKYVLDEILGISDPKTDKRIEFTGGIRGLKELEKRADLFGGVAFSMYPTSIGELFDVADAGRLMPPKSTWFEPKLRSGLFIHLI